MLTPEMNDRLTRVGPGTPGGNLLRYYWHPIAPAMELAENPIKRIRLLGEDLVLYRDRSGTYGLIDERCPHRRASMMELGIVEDVGIRCAYHGWRFGASGACLEQPCEPWNSTYKNNIGIKAYPVQELGGLIFAYLGPDPVPLLPRYELLVCPDVIRRIGVTQLPCNWLQCVENSLDPVHVEWLHGRFMDDVYEQQGSPLGQRKPARHDRIGFDIFEHGIQKRRIMEGQDEDVETWTVGHPLIFPNTLQNSRALFFRVPIDDTHTEHLIYQIYRSAAPVPEQKVVPYYDVPLTDENGRYNKDALIVQDFVAWISQGAIARRDLERLGQSDVGVIMYRQLLQEQIERVEEGQEPTIGIFRDPAANRCVTVPEARLPFNGMQNMPESERIQQPWAYERFDPRRDEIVAFLRESEQLVADGQAPTLDDPPRVPMRMQRHKYVQILPPAPEPVRTSP